MGICLSPKLKDFLLNQTSVNTVVKIYDSGYLIGMAYIDSEDLFINSLNEEILNRHIDTTSKNSYDVMIIGKDFETTKQHIVEVNLKQ